MAETLGEKLRKAREDLDISISEVAEQTRISALYLEAIEKDEYKILPGGIFNKGFVKSFAKYVGLDEHEALQDYARLLEQQAEEAPDLNDSRGYRPEVLTDDSRRGSMIPTIIFAVVILGLMAWGIHALVKYVESSESSSNEIADLKTNDVKNDVVPDSNSNTAANGQNNIPATDSIKLKISTTAEELSITSTADGKRETVNLTADIKERLIEAEDSVKLNYYKGLADTVFLELNGKKIGSPEVPAGYRNTGLEYEINMGNIKKILQDGKIDLGAPQAPNANTAANSNTAQ
jgi:cytoskeletal protein RodZ